MSPLVRTPCTRIAAAIGLLLSLASAGSASAAVTVRIDNSEQRMRVFVGAGLAYSWPVSTARRGYRTPPGSYRVQRMERMWHSRKYDMSPMPYSLFFHGGYAIHGTYSIRQLGRPASHGCVRLHPANARALFSIVRSYGGARVVVTD
jgi:lipoprotein-anchoring transpeptidase ErfK/SrfK